MNRKVGWGEVAAALALGALVVLATRGGDAGRLSALVLRALGVAFFLLFAFWFSRAVYASVRAAPDYALFGYAMLAFTLASWGLAFLYPFPIRGWQDLLRRDIAFYAGVPAPLLLLLLLALGKAVFVPGTWSGRRHRVARGAPGARGRAGRMLLAGALLGVFLIVCVVHVANDLRDLLGAPVVAEDTLTQYFHTLRSDDSVRFRRLGSLRLPHGASIASLRRGERYLILYTPRARLLVGLRPLPGASSRGPGVPGPAR